MKRTACLLFGWMMIVSAFAGLNAAGQATEPPAVAADPTLVADLQMNEGSGQYAQDSTANNNDAVLGDLSTPQDSDPAWSNGLFGGCLDFNGTSDIITLPDSASLHLVSQTVEFWAEVPAGGDDCTLFREEFDANVSVNEVVTMFAGGRIQYNINEGSHIIDTGPGAFVPGGWQHFAFTRSGSPSGIARIYVNGVLLKNGSYSGHESGSAKPLRIAGSDTFLNTGDHFDGKIDGLRIWSRELNGTEIMASYLRMFAPLRIDSNADFSAHASSGTGTESNPWIIENLTVDGTGLGYGIYIGNTSQYFVLRNCTVSNATGGTHPVYYPNAGLVLFNVTKGTVKNCTFRDNGFYGAFMHYEVRKNTFNDSGFINNGINGICANQTRNSEFNRLTVTGNTEDGILLHESPNNYLMGNNVSGNGGSGLTVIGNNNFILDNIFHMNGGSGVEITHDTAVNGSAVNEVSGNTVQANGAHGIAVRGAPGLLVQTQNNTVSYNTITGNDADGLHIEGPNQTIAFNNSLSDNGGYGANISSGADNYLYHNRFVSNNLQARDVAANTIWNDTYPSGGNYWDDYTGADLLSGTLQDQVGSDGIGDTPYSVDADSIDWYPLWMPAGIDFIAIVDGSNGTGNPAGAHEFAYPGFSITLWSAGYNDTYGYVRDVSANWTNANYSGAQSEITNATGVATTWQAGPNEGTALLTAEFGGMTCDVNVTISTYVADLRIDGKTDDVYEPTPVTQKSWKNITQGGSAAYTIVAQNDGLAAGTFGLAWDISGLPGSFSPVIFDTDAGTNVTADIIAGTLTFYLNPGATANFLLRINSTATAGFGQSATVNISVVPPGGEPDNGTAIVGVFEPDYLELTATPGGTPLTNVDLFLSQQITAYASAYNASGPTYLGLVPVNWTALPVLGDFDDNSSVTAATFTAEATGTAVITGEGFGLSDTFSVIISVSDTAPPESSANEMAGYWLNTSPQVIEATASDGTSGIANVTLWFRYSENNHTWDAWCAFTTDAATPWAWIFAFPNGSGYYEFYSVAADVAGNMEAPPAGADASCAYDSVKPTIEDISPTDAETGDIFTVTATILDEVLRLHGAHLIYWFGTGTETNVTFDGNGLRTYNITIPEDSLDDLSYIIAAVDWAGNWNTTSARDISITDGSTPTADAGADRDAETGNALEFDGSGSDDNIGILNYTWTFTYNGTQITLYGVSPEFTFWTEGNYTVTLTVADAEGLQDSDEVVISVHIPEEETDGGSGDGSSPAEYWWIILIIVLVLTIILMLFLLKGKKKEDGAQDGNVPEGKAGSAGDGTAGDGAAGPTQGEPPETREEI